MLTAYDYPTARIVDEAGIPLILVGDSLGEVMLGYESTVRVTMDEMLHHAQAVVRGTSDALVVGDMPFLTYATPDEARRATPAASCSEAGRAGRQGRGRRPQRADDRDDRQGRHPGHGPHRLTPQAQRHGRQDPGPGQGPRSARALLADALAVQEAGAFAVVLELVPAQLAAAITERLRIPTIGIGAGPAARARSRSSPTRSGSRRLHPQARAALRAPRRPLRRGDRGLRGRRHVGDVPRRGAVVDDGRAVLDDALASRSTAGPSPGILAIPLDRDL